MHKVNTGSLGLLAFLAIIVPALVAADATTTLIATPSSGQAPLTVTFTSNTAASSTATSSSALYFGDGSIGELGEHTYRVRGTYTAMLVTDAPCLHEWPRCAIPVSILATTSVVVSPRPVATSTLPDLQSQIQALFQQIQQMMAQIRELLASLPQRPVTPPGSSGGNGGIGWCAAMQRLERGARGNGVSALQTFLKDRGHFDKSNITGFFGQQTEEAVRRFQEREGVVSSGDGRTTGFGVVGARTMKAMKKYCQDQATEQRETPRHDTPGDEEREPEGNDRGGSRIQIQRCPDGTFGLYPACLPKIGLDSDRGRDTDDQQEGNEERHVCPSGYTGTYPDCTQVIQPCPAGTTGTYPSCMSATSSVALQPPSILYANCDSLGTQLTYSWPMGIGAATGTRYVLRIQDGSSSASAPFTVATTTALSFTMNAQQGHQYYARIFASHDDTLDQSSAGYTTSSPYPIICAAL